MHTLDKCPSCQATLFSDWLICKDYTVSNQQFKIVGCQKCGLKFTNPRPDETEIGAYYESEAYISHTNEGKGLIDFVYRQVRKLAVKSKIELINNLRTNKGQLLDIGCGTGYFMSQAKENGWVVAATEPGQKPREEAARLAQIEVKETIFDLDRQGGGKPYDIVTMWHVLEHVHELHGTIGWIKDHLTTNGKLVVAVPNHESYDAKVFQEHWAAYDVPRHLYHFSATSMRELMLQHRLKIETIKPMKFDTFYVSLLSTKYKYGVTKPLQAFWTGLLSNLKADQKQYSSLIYVISKI